MKLSPLEVNEYIAVAEEALCNDEEYQSIMSSLYKERDNFLKAGLTDTIEGILFEKWQRVIGYILEHKEEIEKKNEKRM